MAEWQYNNKKASPFSLSSLFLSLSLCRQDVAGHDSPQISIFFAPLRLLFLFVLSDSLSICANLCSRISLTFHVSSRHTWSGLSTAFTLLLLSRILTTLQTFFFLVVLVPKFIFLNVSSQFSSIYHFSWCHRSSCFSTAARIVPLRPQLFSVGVRSSSTFF